MFASTSLFSSSVGPEPLLASFMPPLIAGAVHWTSALLLHCAHTTQPLLHCSFPCAQISLLLNLPVLVHQARTHIHTLKEGIRKGPRNDDERNARTTRHRCRHRVITLHGMNAPPSTRFSYKFHLCCDSLRVAYLHQQELCNKAALAMLAHPFHHSTPMLSHSLHHDGCVGVPILPPVFWPGS